MNDLLIRNDEINSASIVSKMVELNRRKLESVVSLIFKIRADYPEDKIVLFSNYTKTLKQLRYFLSKESIHNLNSIYYDGSLTLSERVKILNQFQSCNIPILLASKMATSLGIDLTCANHIIFIDSWWNPQIRNQAIARCWRPGQKKSVFVYSLHTSESIEDDLLKAQRNKETLFNKIFFNGCCSSIEDKVTLWIDHPYSYNSRPTEKKDILNIVNKFQLENAPQILCMFTNQNGQRQGRRRVLVKRTSKQLPNLNQLS
jgi:SNF2 family DNA or RNA helicase